MATFTQAPTTAAQFKDNFIVAEQIVARRLGLPLVNFTPAEYQALPPADAVRFTDALATFVVEHPTYFAPQTLAVAQERVSSKGFGGPMADTSFAFAVEDFGNEVVNNAADLANAFPRLLAGLAVAAVVVFVAAKVLPGAIAKARAS